MSNSQLAHSHHHGGSSKDSLCILANDINLPTNVGSLFRISDALGVEFLFLTGTTVTPPNPKIRKTSRCAEKCVPHQYVSDPLLVLQDLKRSGYRIVCLELTSISIDIADFSVQRGDCVCLIVGSESRGVAQILLDNSDITIHIPMRGYNSSMNVANACAIATYEIARKLLVNQR